MNDYIHFSSVASMLFNVKSSSLRLRIKVPDDTIDITITDDSLDLKDKILASLNETIPQDALAVEALRDMLDVTAPSSSGSSFKATIASLAGKVTSQETSVVASLRSDPKVADKLQVGKSIFGGGASEPDKIAEVINPASLDFDFLAKLPSLSKPDAAGDDSGFDDFDGVFVSGNTTTETVSTPLETANESGGKISAAVVRFLESLPNLNFVLE
jgi:hypothetical protein